MKELWLNNVNFEWLIMGHLVEEEALKIVRDVESALKFKALDKDDLTCARLVSLPQNTITEYNEISSDPSNPNSAVAVIL
jgi:secreted Zn-dependent insulinase-like peptidase